MEIAIGLGDAWGKMNTLLPRQPSRHASRLVYIVGHLKTASLLLMPLSHAVHVFFCHEACKCLFITSLILFLRLFVLRLFFVLFVRHMAHDHGIKVNDLEGRSRAYTEMVAPLLGPFTAALAGGYVVFILTFKLTILIIPAVNVNVLVQGRPCENAFLDGQAAGRKLVRSFFSFLLLNLFSSLTLYLP